MALRDLALRNCLVGTGPVVKVADFDGQHQVVRFTLKTIINIMTEAVEFNKFTTQSDCWSYGVTLWEICEKGKVPYSSMSNQEVLHAVKAGMTLEFPDGLKSYCNCGCSTPATASTTTTTTEE
ncbi:Protein tyrosine and serine/threonine kinase [Pelomyxa schiedti]|nr:Protein tyrosine and serine/threonine kinase [Pelomyxa schiedti]